MGRPRVYQRIDNGALERAARQARSASHLARLIGVDGSTARRWVRSGRVRLGAGPRAVAPQAPLPAGSDVAINEAPDWAARIRADFDLGAEHDRVLTLAEQAYAMTRDVALPAPVRLAASREYTRLMEMLNLQEDADDATTAPTHAYPRRA